MLSEFATQLHCIAQKPHQGKIDKQEFVLQISDAFTSDLFIACMERSLGIRSEHSLCRAVNDAIAKWRSELLSFWTNTFELPGMTQAEQETHWAIASNTLRGRGFTTSFGLQASAAEHMQRGLQQFYMATDCHELT